VNTLAERLRYARNLRKLTQKELARRANVSQGAISNFENQLRYQPRDIFQLATALNVSPVWLLNGTPPMELAISLPTPGGTETIGEPLLHYTWPFPQILPADYFSLSAEKRELVEAMALTMLCQAGKSE
jgi:transcriptional regulator with XRE-family HTH domain